MNSKESATVSWTHMMMNGKTDQRRERMSEHSTKKKKKSERKR